MSIKPAMGWLALLLFTTTAQAEGSRDLLKGAEKMSSKAPITAAVTRKTKAAPVPVAATAPTHAALVIVESTAKPRTDYEAEVYAGVALDSPVAKGRGLDKGLVTMVFERQQRPAFRIGRERIKRVVRLAAEDRTAVTQVRTGMIAHPKDLAMFGGQAPRAPQENLRHSASLRGVDVLETEDGVVVVDTTVLSAGMFVTSDVYVFAKNATLHQRIGSLEPVPAPTRDRLREALVAAEWAPIR